jgi:hypothetical protein
LKRIIGALAVAAALTIASTAIAASAGTYRGTSVLHLDGSTASHPFGITVKNGRVTDARFLAGSDCGVLVDTRGVRAAIKIKHNRFNGRIPTLGGGMLHLIGQFKGRRVSGTFTGRTKGGSASCAVIPKNTFSAKLG